MKYSVPFRIYQYFFKGYEKKNEKKETEFYQSFLPACHLIFDIGAYDGHKTAAFLKIAKRVICCEPDAANFLILQTRFRNKSKRVFPENKAVSDIPGTSIFHIHHPGSAFNTLSSTWQETLEKDNMEKWNEKIKFSEERLVQTTTLDLLIKKYGNPDFIKIDVEGYEENVLKGLSQPVSFLSFEALWPAGSVEIQNCLDRIHNIDAKALYNLAVHEKLLLPAFVGREDMMARLEKNDILHLEIIVKMCQ